jgi:predicted site-specific integrase-resolvase
MHTVVLPPAQPGTQGCAGRKAAIYGRVIPQSQDRSGSGQIARCERYAAEMGFSVTAVSTDVCFGWTHPQESAAFCQMHQAADREEFSVLLLTELYRLSYRSDLTEQVLDDLKAHGVRIIILELENLIRATCFLVSALSHGQRWTKVSTVGHNGQWEEKGSAPRQMI